MTNQTNDVIRDAKQLGIPKMLILGLQHMFAMFGATILVPILVNSYFTDACGEGPTHGLTVAVTLFCAGFGTLLFHVCSRFQVPAFLGSSFAFLGGFSTVANLNTGMYATMSVNDKAAYACGGVVVAGLMYLVLALIIRLVGVKRVMRFLPPVVTGPVIICIGLTLAGSAINNASTNWFLALVALAVIIIFNIWGKGMFKIIPGIFCHQHLIDQRAYTHHKEFIQIALIDRCKCQALTQRHLRVLRFFQYTFIKFQPGQFPVHINCLVHCLSLYFLLPFIQLSHSQKYYINFSLILC